MSDKSDRWVPYLIAACSILFALAAIFALLYFQAIGDVNFNKATDKLFIDQSKQFTKQVQELQADTSQLNRTIDSLKNIHVYAPPQPQPVLTDHGIVGKPVKDIADTLTNLYSPR